MPWPYQFANPEGRPYHNDWGIMSSNPVLKAMQPWQKIKRIDCAYRVPLPFKKIAGNAKPIWTPLLKPWPIAPDGPVSIMPYYDGEQTINTFHVLTMHPIHKSGQWSRQAVYLGGQWTECYFSSSWGIFGNRATVYYGLRLDPNPSDLMAWFPEMSASIKWGRSD